MHTYIDVCIYNGATKHGINYTDIGYIQNIGCVRKNVYAEVNVSLTFKSVTCHTL